MKGFEALSPDELEALTQAPAKVMILIAGADGVIDREERFWSSRLVTARTYSKPVGLNEFYKKIAENFLANADGLLSKYPSDPEVRNGIISSELSRLNDILPKLDPYLAAKLYEGFRSMAEEAARASGGFLRFGATSSVEGKWVQLPMLKEIPIPPGIVEDEWEDWDEKPVEGEENA